MKEVNQIFHFKPFSQKQRKVLNWWCDASPVKDYDGIIADGAIRSGKTISMSLSYVLWAMTRFNGQNFGMCGKTIGSFRRNVLFWLKLMLRSRGYNLGQNALGFLLGKRRAQFFLAPPVRAAGSNGLRCRPRACASDRIQSLFSFLGNCRGNSARPNRSPNPYPHAQGTAGP